MFKKRFGQMSMFAALVPLAALSAAWTAAATGTGFDPAEPVQLPGGEPMATSVIEQPASVTVPAPAQGARKGARTGTIAVALAKGSDIPLPALAAYQRSAAVVTTADRACALEWSLLAAVGMVESDHGRLKSSRLGDDGKATPAIYGPTLTTAAGQPEPDTDGGSYDKLTSGDRAIGPMQFVPSTWPLVAVDGDGDGVRDPQDIDDAALAAAVYLCSGDDDISSAAGQKAALSRYNHSDAYVSTVLTIAKGYADSPYGGDDITLVAAPGHDEPRRGDQPGTKAGDQARHNGQKPGPKSGNGTATSQPGSVKPTSGAKPADDAGSTPSETPAPAPSETPTEEPDDGNWASTSERHDICAPELAARFPDLAAGWDTNRAIESCSIKLIGKTVPQAKAAVPGVVTNITDYVEWLIKTAP